MARRQMQTMGCGAIVGRGIVQAQPALTHSEESVSRHSAPFHPPALSCGCPSSPDSSGLCTSSLLKLVLPHKVR